MAVDYEGLADNLKFLSWLSQKTLFYLWSINLYLHFHKPKGFKKGLSICCAKVVFRQHRIVLFDELHAERKPIKNI
ncbi:hypothetical protein [Algoriphagus namhaensis]